MEGHICWSGLVTQEISDGPASKCHIAINSVAVGNFSCSRRSMGSIKDHPV